MSSTPKAFDGQLSNIDVTAVKTVEKSAAIASMLPETREGKDANF